MTLTRRVEDAIDEQVDSLKDYLTQQAKTHDWDELDKEALDEIIVDTSLAWLDVG